MPYMKTFYHATTVPEWDTVVTHNDIWVHLGTQNAARERASRVTVEGLRILESHDLYSAELLDDARQHVNLIEDLDENWESLNTAGYDVFYYRNAHESAGEISIYVRARALKNLTKVSVLSPQAT